MIIELTSFFGYGNKEVSIDLDTCVFCGNQVDIEGFKDAESVKEFYISGLCQQCQDRIFEELT
jgi:hypothetical protein